ncbi:MAG TPA: SpoIIE family protein phosphatase [Vicinamibacteria bacterium]|nr:SpoIIE family protein phosphatase [Vicinamibacteria bacterium]
MKPPRALLRAAAVALSAASLTVGVLSLYFAGAQGAKMSEELGLPDDHLLDPPVRLAFKIRGAEAGGVRVGPVDREGAAERAGLREDDVIVAVNGRSLAGSAAPFLAAYRAARPGDVIELTVVRPGEASPIGLRAVFVSRPLGLRVIAGVRVVYRTLAFLPLAFLAVALPVLFLRLEDVQAWRVAALLVSIAGVTSAAAADASLAAPALALVYAYRGICSGLMSFSCYRFFCAFPARSPVDRRLPWLKWALLGLGVLFALGGAGAGRRGAPWLPAVVAAALGTPLSQALWYAYNYGGIALGLAALVATAASNPSRDARLKIRVMVFGAVAGLGPAVVLNFLADLGLWDRASTLSTVAYLTVFLFPLSFAYAVVKHRVLELPVLLKRSARYLLVKRGFFLLLVLVGAQASALFAVWLSRGFRLEPPLATTGGVGFGFLLAAVSAPAIRMATRLIDRSFFRDAYDARLILEELAESIRTVTARDELAALLRRQLDQALHPGGIVVYLEADSRRLRSDDPGVPAALREIEASSLAQLAREDRPRSVGAQRDDVTRSLLAALAPECLVPIVGREARLLGLVVLGQRLSEEPYARDDERLLASVANQAGIALENMALAARIAERLQAEQRAAHEMELARQVQARLLPASGPPLAHLEYAGRCVQARAVGGDYYDFIDAGEGHLGLVLADVSGKGFPAALLVASLHAALRSQTPARDLPEQLNTVNRLLYEATEANRYATVFLGLFDDSSRRLRYVNCGHNPPLLLRADGCVEKLLPTAMVVGLVEDWSASTAEVALCPGDALAIYSDGITEATDAGGEEFGEERLLRALQDRPAADPKTLLDLVFDEVRRFAEGEQGDDQTLVIARVR